MRLENWGLIDYESSVAKQTEYVDRVSEGAEECLVICTHPPVVTLGRAASSEDMLGWTGATVESSRGGRATYHGPSQIVIYPILDLKKPQAVFRERDIHSYLRALEKITVRCLHEVGLPSAEARTSQVGEVSLTGVWVGDRKIASLGIAIRKWISYHGIAINLLDDPQAFKGIRPCGFSADVMTSVERELGESVDYLISQKLFARIFCEGFANPSHVSESHLRNSLSAPAL